MLADEFRHLQTFVEIALRVNLRSVRGRVPQNNLSGLQPANSPHFRRRRVP